jgi:hypothetical protein
LVLGAYGYASFDEKFQVCVCICVYML